MALGPELLTPAQHGGIEFLLRNPNAAIWGDMGSGKTALTLSATAEKIRRFEISKTLVVAPKRVARDVWSDEIADWEHLQGLSIATAIGTEQQRLDALNAGADVTTINWENLLWLENLFVDERDRQIRRWPWDQVILDEASWAQTWGAKRSRMLRRMRKFFPYCVELTGTPTPNGYDGLLNQAYLLDQGKRLGKTQTAYRNKWFIPPNDIHGKWIPKDGAVQEIQKALADLVYVIRDPNPVTPVIPVRVKLADDVLDAYRRFERDAILDAQLKGVNAGALAGKLLQFANGAVYNEDGSYRVIHDQKLDVLEELLAEVDGPVMVAYYFRHDLERISKRLEEWQKRTGKRIRKLDTAQDQLDWNAGKIDVLLIHPASAGHGLNLQHSGSKLIIWHGLTYNLEHFLQLNARLAGGHRRQEGVRIMAIVADQTRDAQMLPILARKGATQDDLKRAIEELRK